MKYKEALPFNCPIFFAEMPVPNELFSERKLLDDFLGHRMWCGIQGNAKGGSEILF